MATTRDQIAVHLGAELGELLDEAGITPSAEDGLKQPIDAALRYLGVTDANLSGPFTTTPSAQALFTVAEWTTLRRIQRALAVKVDIEVDAPQVSKKRSQLFAQLTKLIEDAKDAAYAYIESDAQDEWQVGWMNHDLLTPAFPLLGGTYDGLS
jgi:hypothetical protein